MLDKRRLWAILGVFSPMLGWGMGICMYNVKKWGGNWTQIPIPHSLRFLRPMYAQTPVVMGNKTLQNPPKIEKSDFLQGFAPTR